MLSKEIFTNFINNYLQFTEGIDRVGAALYGNGTSSNLFEADWYLSVNNMLDYFLESNFTEVGLDLVYWWLFEDVEKVIYEKPNQRDFFNEFQEDIETSVETIEQLWNYMMKNKEVYLIQ